MTHETENLQAVEVGDAMKKTPDASDILPFPTVDAARSDVQSSAVAIIDDIEDSEDVGTKISLDRKAA